MSLVGVRDMSVIETPPQDRLPIQTMVAPLEDELVCTRGRSELARDGQVFFIHNRVEWIYSLAALVSKLVPKARVVVATAKWGKTSWKGLCWSFSRRVQRAGQHHHRGEMYSIFRKARHYRDQPPDRRVLRNCTSLRGRVGRASQRAYAYCPFFRKPARLLSRGSACPP